jgi:hypothetical protein
MQISDLPAPPAIQQEAFEPRPGAQLFTDPAEKAPKQREPRYRVSSARGGTREVRGNHGALAARSSADVRSRRGRFRYPYGKTAPSNPGV